MKYVRKSASFLVLFIVASMFITTLAEGQTESVSPPESTWDVEFVVLEDQLLPPDESFYDADFGVVYNNFLEIVRNRDFAALDSLWEASYGPGDIETAFKEYYGFYRTDVLAGFLWETLTEIGQPISNDDFGALFYEVRNTLWSTDLDALDSLSAVDVESSFSSRDGKAIACLYLKYFEKNWKKLMWEEFEYIIAPNGASYDASVEKYTVPYTIYFCANGEGYAIIDQKVPVYEEPDIASNVIEYLYYNILQDGWGRANDPDFAKIRTLSGAEGYVQWEYLRAPWGVCCEFKRNDDGDWKMVFLGSLD